jgi:hypothetical protein
MSTSTDNVAVIEEIVVTGSRIKKKNSGVPVASSSDLSLDTWKLNEDTISSKTRKACTQLVAVLEQGTTNLSQLQTGMLGDQYVSSVSDSQVYYYRLAPYGTDKNLLLDLAYNVYLPYTGAYAADEADPFLYDTGLTRTAFESGSDLDFLVNLGTSHLNSRQVMYGTAASAFDWSYSSAGFAEETTDPLSIGLGLGVLASSDALTIALEGIYVIPKAQITSLAGVGDKFGNDGSGGMLVGATNSNGIVLDLGGSSDLCTIRLDMSLSF